MNLAESAGRVSPAIAQMAEAAKDVEDEYNVAPAENLSELDAEGAVEAATKTEAAVMVDDPRKFAPTKQLNEKHRDGSKEISVKKLQEGGSGVSFEGEAGVSTGMKITGVRKCTLFLSKFLPSIYDQRDFVSYGEIVRYVAVKDHVLFVYAEKTSPNYLYTVPLGTLKAMKEDPNKPHKRSVTVSPGFGSGLNRQDGSIETVVLVDALGKLAYQISFDVKVNKNIADNFVAAVRNINVAEKSMEKK